jgi:hypothetical protein
MLLKGIRKTIIKTCILSLLFLLLGLTGLINGKPKTVMYFQIIASIILICSYIISYLLINRRKSFNHYIVIALTDFPAMIFCCFIIVYLIVISIYNLLSDFSWFEFILIIINIIIGTIFFNASVSFNLITGFITFFAETDEIIMPDNEWDNFKFKNQISNLE